MSAGDERRILMAMDAPRDPRLCRIEQSLGRSEICPGASCPLWEQTGDPQGGRCLFDGLDLAGRHDLATWLHDLREQLGTLSLTDDANRRLFFVRLNAGRSD